MMTARMLEYVVGATDIPFPDNNQVGTGYDVYVAEAYAQGIIRGYQDDTFRPKGAATRAEAAVMAIRTLRILGLAEMDAHMYAAFWLESAGSRLEQMLALAETGRSDHIKPASRLYSSSLDNAVMSAAKADQSGVEVGRLLRMLSGTSSHHVGTLITIHDMVPIAAQSDVEGATRSSISVYYAAVRELINRRELFHSRENLVTIHVDDVAGNPILAKLHEKRAIEISTDVVDPSAAGDLTQAVHSQNYLAQLLDALVGYEVRESQRVHSVRMSQNSLVTFQVATSSNLIGIGLDSGD